MQGFFFFFLIYGFIFLIQLTPYSQNITTIFGNSKRVSKFDHHKYILSTHAWLKKIRATKMFLKKITVKNLHIIDDSAFLIVLFYYSCSHLSGNNTLWIMVLRKKSGQVGVTNFLVIWNYLTSHYKCLKC